MVHFMLQILCQRYPGLRKVLTLRSIRARRTASSSSNKWLQRQKKDPLVKRASIEQYRCRSAYKLMELDDKYHFLQKGANVVDCGACPGAWSQVAAERVGVRQGNSEMAHLPGVVVMGNSDVTEPAVHERVREILGGSNANIVMSDMAPNASGIHEMDHQRIMQLAQSAFALSQVVLKEGGVFVCKLWQGSLTTGFRHKLKANFGVVKECRLKSTRKESSEIYIFANNYFRQVLTVLAFIAAVAAARNLGAPNTPLSSIETLRFNTRSPTGWILLLTLIALPIEIFILIARFLNFPIVNKYSFIFFIMDICISIAIGIGFFGGAVPLVIHANQWAFWRSRGSYMENTRYGLNAIVPSVAADAAFSFLASFGYFAMGFWMLVFLFFKWNQHLDEYIVNPITIESKKSSNADGELQPTVSFENGENGEGQLEFNENTDLDS